MIRLTLAQMRRSLGRLVAAGLAIALGTGFVTATLLAGQTMTRVTEESVTLQYADADLVLSGGVRESDVVAVREVPGVTAASFPVRVPAQVGGPSGSTYAELVAPAAHPALEPYDVVEGRVPGAGELALHEDVAERLDVGLGGSVRVTLWSWDLEAEEGVEETTTRTLVGLVASSGPFGTVEQIALVPAQDVAAAHAYVSPGEEPSAWTALVALDGSRPLADVQDDVRAAVGPDVTVRTKAEEAAHTVEQLTGSATALLTIVLGFAAVALVVAALVIANTFQVIVAQRTHTLALLRCIGADRRQLRRSVLTEAGLLGVAASVTGLVLGTALFQGLLYMLRRWAPDVPIPTAVLPDLVAVVVPVVVGVLVTTAAALVPARAATRVAPLAALRPAEGPSTGRRAGKVRATFALLLIGGGAAGLALGVVASLHVDPIVGLGVGVLGGAASFVGVMVGAVFWVPWLLRAVDALTRRVAGPSGRLASANAVRNPRRTAATSAALLIGVTLVAMMSTGAASTRVALDEALVREFPVDVVIASGVGGEPQALPAGLADDVAATDGVRSVADVLGTSAAVRTPVVSETDLTVLGLDPALADEVLHDPVLVAGVRDGGVLLPRFLSRDVEHGDAVVVTGPDGTEVTAPAVVTELQGDTVIVPADVVRELDPQAPVTTLWASLDDVQRASDVVPALSDLASATDEGLYVAGAAIERGFYQRVISTLLAVVVGLLAVSVVIALVGVANTLALSVIERRRENATLRAVGMSKRQLRASLAVEGLLIAAAGGLTGAVLGTVYGWIGARTVLGELTPVSLVVPWADLAAVLAVALGAGLLASVLPARGAVRTSPVEALAVG